MSCVHHYVLPAVGVTVTGVCRKCGATREFSNAIPETVMSKGIVAMYKAGARKRSIVLTPAETRDWVL